MPVTIIKIAKGDHYKVVTPNGVHAHDTTLAKAQAVKRIIDAYERKQKIKAKKKA